jgi:D-serine deaminase-like pyridoxal phosphate-dependent protein
VFDAIAHPAADRARYDRATARLDAPLAIVDLAAFDANAADIVRRAGGKPVRVASKSVRCRALSERVLKRDGFQGVMSFALAESLWPARSGVSDVLLAYPSVDRAGYAELAADPKLSAAVTVMVGDADDPLLGDKVWFRHAKAGELSERFDALQLIDGDRITATVPTYHGEGRTFL